MNDTQTRVLLTVLDVHATEGRVTIRDVAARVDRHVATVHAHLRRLRAMGLVTWEDGRSGTLRPLVEQRFDSLAASGRLGENRVLPATPSTTSGELADTGKVPTS